MAGEGKRFKELNIKEIKYKIQLGDKPIFQYAIRSLLDFINEKFIFITQKKHKSKTFIKKQCQRVGITNLEIIELKFSTDGQASTAYQAKDIIKRNDEIAIFNIDTYIEEGELLKKDITGDGFIPVFKSEGGRFSFVKIDPNGKVIEVAEKKRISNLATVGFYYFKKWSLFMDTYEENHNIVKKTYGETYIAPLYNWLIRNGKEVRVKEINNKKIHILGTPQEVLEFYPNFKSYLKN